MLFACVAGPAPAAENSPADIAAITQIEHGISTTMNVEDLPKYYAPDIVLYDMLGNFLDMKSVRKNFIDFMSAVKNLRADFLTLTIESNGDLAYAYSIQKATFVMKDGGTLQTTYRETDCLKKKNGKWLIVHSQVSVPVDVKTGKAMLNAAP
jgi:ketosteroid isomerase-like protein